MRRLWIGGITLVIAVTALVVVPAAPTESFTVEQGSECIQITPLGDGTQSVEEFYDYRSPETTPEGAYTSYGTTDIQRSQTSQLFVYNGENGLSLVFLHDKFGDDGGGFAATATISGLPADGEWVVEDDSYANRDDVFDHANRSSRIEWVANGNRTDGAAFRGLGSSNDTTITVEIAFNDESNRYPFEEWQGSPEQNQIEQWIARSGSGETTELDMDEPVRISSGTCGTVSTTTATPTAPTPTETAPTAETIDTRPVDEQQNSTYTGDAPIERDDGQLDPQPSIVTVFAVALVLLAALALVRQD